MSADIERLRKAASTDPAQLVKLADTLVANGRADEAVQACRRGLGARPDDVPLRLALGRALSAAGHLEEAQAALLDAVSRQSRAAQRPADARPAAPTTAVRARREDPTELSTRPPKFSDSGEVEIEGEPTNQEWQPDLMPQTEPAHPSARRDPTRQVTADDIERDEPAHGSDEAYVQDADPYGRDSYVPRGQPYVPPSYQPAGPIDLEQVAERLMGDADGEAPASWTRQPADPVPDEMRRGWEARRARAFVWLWAALIVTTGGIVGGWIYRAHQRTIQIAAAVEQADGRVREATFEGDAAARDAYATVLRLEPRSRKYAAMVALASARLAADQGADTDAAAWTMLRRSEVEAARHKPEPDERAERELRQARALLALARGETCSPTDNAVDGDIAARCALQHGDLTTARAILNAATSKTDLRGLLIMGSLELGAGDLDAADAAYNKVLAIAPAHPRALVGRAIVALERGETPKVTPPQVKLGPTTEAWFHLAAGELDAARKGIVHDGRLALLYGRARLNEGRVADAEQAMRVAERLDPNDGDVAVLDAEVALAKGFEDKVASALSV